MPFPLLRKKAAATNTSSAPTVKGKEISFTPSAPLPKIVHSQHQQDVMQHPTSAMGAMSIQYDERSHGQSTYQQPSSSSSAALRPQRPASYLRPYPNSQSYPEVIDQHQQPHVSLKELRGLTTGDDGSFRRPRTAQSTDRERKASTSTARNGDAGRRPSTMGGYPTLRQQNSAPSLSQQYVAAGQSSQHHYQPHQPSHQPQISYDSTERRAPQQQKSSYRRSRSDSMSSASSYAASETSDILYNSVGRSSSGGTSATTPGSGSDREKERSYMSKAAPVARMPTTVERVPVPVPSATMQEDRRPNMVRPVSETSTVTMSQGSRTDSPVMSQTSSMIRKTASRYTLADFHFIRTLGTGSFGRVHLVRSCHNTRFYAVKVLNKERVVKMKQVEHTNSEREMLERVRHPFLVNLWGTFKDSANLYMVMDFVSGGELFSLLRKSQRFPDPVAKFFAAEVALALDYLHSLDIIYRDLKPENILLGADGHVKITDFGFAKYVPDITWTLCGTPDYLAPEVVQSRGYNKSVDWYALGVLVFEMLAGYPPFFTEDSNPMRLYEKIIAGKIRYPSYFTGEAKDLLCNLLTADLTKRFGNLANGSRDIFGHAYFAEVDWNRLYRKEIPAPYVPRVEGDGDSSNFDTYAEIDLSEYGMTGPDPHGHLFSCF